MAISTHIDALQDGQRTPDVFICSTSSLVRQPPRPPPVPFILQNHRRLSKQGLIQVAFTSTFDHRSILRPQNAQNQAHIPLGGVFELGKKSSQLTACSPSSSQNGDEIRRREFTEPSASRIFTSPIASSTIHCSKFLTAFWKKARDPSSFANSTTRSRKWF